ncbi:MAG: A24 family peptidase [Steroidobacteraceae bacterium]
MFELLALHPGLGIALAGVLGLLIGSFLNVVIHRLPKMLEREWRAQCAELGAELGAGPGIEPGAEPTAGSAARGAPATGPAPPYNLVTPRSACPHCQAPIKAHQNIPVVSWLLLGRRCAACHAPISVRYPLIELLSGVLSALVVWKFGFGWPALAALCITWVLIALTVIDLDHQLLPDNLTLPLLWAGLLASLAASATAAPALDGFAAAAALVTAPTTTLSLPVRPEAAIIGAAVGYLSLWSVYQLFKLATGKEGMGYGDFKLLAALGAWLGYRMLLPIILISACVGALSGILLIVTGRQARGQPIPFGPFLAAAGWVAMMWGPELVQSYFGLFATR